VFFKQAGLTRSGTMAMSIEPDGIKIWSLTDRKPQPIVFRHDSEIISAQLIREGTTLFVSDKERGHLWRLNDQRRIATQFVYNTDAVDARLTRDDRYLYVSNSAELIRWDLLNGRRDEWDVGSVAMVSPRGTRWLVDSSLIDASKPVSPPISIDVRNSQLRRFSADDSLLATDNKNKGEIEIWSTASGKIVAGPLILGSAVADLAFDEQARRLVAAGYDGSVKVWELDGSEANVVASWNQTYVVKVGFSRDGAHLFSTSPDVVQIREIEDNTLLATIRTECSPSSISF